MAPDIEKIKEYVRGILIEIGEDPDRDGLLKTPERVARSLSFLTSGYSQDPQKVLNQACFSQQTNSMIVVKNIEVYSLCEHHLLPFFGRCHVGYICDGKVPGCSKIARMVDAYARRLQIQERLTEEISYAIQETVEAIGVAVIIEARHLCMMMRGVEKQNSVLVTSSMLGTFRDRPATRNEFLSLIDREKF